MIAHQRLNTKRQRKLQSCSENSATTNYWKKSVAAVRAWCFVRGRKVSTAQSHLKVISLGQWASKAHLKRFRLEAEAAARLEHPGIVPIHEVGERDGSCYFSMKFVEGGQLDEVARREPMPIRRAVELIAKVARTVHYAHEHGFCIVTSNRETFYWMQKANRI